MNKILKNKKLLTHALIIVSIVMLAVISLQAGFAATTHNINNTTSGGINGTLATATDGDIIELEEGTYTGNNNTNMTINKNITIQGKTKDKVILDAQGLSRIFTIGNTLNVTFINTTFINGNVTGNGGAINCEYYLTTMTFINCTFKNNVATVHGGGIIARGDLNITNSYFINNSANNGGGIHASSNNGLGTNICTISDSYFLNNTAIGQSGGLVVATYGTIYVINTTISNNTAFRQGGFYIYSSYDVNITCNIIDSIITNNYADDYFGGLSISSNGANITTNIINCNISNNIAVTDGGGISVHAYLGIVDANIIDSIISGNTAGNNGGGILSYASINGTVTANINNSTIEGNAAGNDGGGISSFTYVGSNGNSTVNIDNSTINDNTAGNDGGGISSSTGENSTGNSNVNVNESDISGNDAGNNGGGVSSSTGVGSDGNSTVNIDDSNINDNTAGNEGGAISSNTGENSTGNSTVNVNNSDLENNTGENGGDTVSSSTGDGSTGNSTVNIDGNSTITNKNPNRNDDGLSSSTGEDSTGESNINIADGVIKRLSANSTIIAPNSTVGKPTTIRGVAKDQNGNPLANVKLTVTVDGKVYIVTTNNVGEWSLTYTPTKIANIQVTVALNQNNVYYAFSKTTSFRAIQTVTLTISAPTIDQGKKTNIKVTLKDANGNILKGKKVSIKIKGKTYTAITNNNGMVIFKIAGLKGGKYTVTAKFAGDNNYKSSITTKVQKVNSKVNLGIVSIKELSNKRLSTCKVTIANTGSLKSKTTILALYHIRNGIKIKTKYIKIKSIAPGKKISIIVNYFPDKANHRYCIAYFTLDPKNKNKEIILANNKKSISLKH